MRQVALILTFDGDIIFVTKGDVDDAVKAYEKRFNLTCIRKEYNERTLEREVLEFNLYHPWWHCEFEWPLGVEECGEISGGSEDTTEVVITTFPLDVFQQDLEEV